MGLSLAYLPKKAANTSFIDVCNQVPHWFIGERHYRLEGMAASEWTCSGRAVIDNPVADYFAPGTNTTRSVAYRPPITVWPLLPTMSVSHCKRSLCRCGPLWPYIGMGSLGTSAKCKSGAPESTCSYGGAFRMLPDLTIRIVKFWRSSVGDLVPYSQSSGS